MNKTIRMIAGLSFMLMAAVSCREDGPETNNTLDVSPSAAIRFNATGNDDVVLAVKTDADSWSVSEIPEWVISSVRDNELVLNAKDNDSQKMRSGVLTVSAGNARPVSIAVVQDDFAVSDGPDVPPVEASLADESGEHLVNIALTGSEKADAKVVLSLSGTSSSDVRAEIFSDAAYVAEYNYVNGTAYVELPDGKVNIDAEEISVKAGDTASETVSVSFETASLSMNEDYMASVCIRITEGNAAVAASTRRVNFIIRKTEPKSTKNILFFQTNDVNPLNALEYILDDGRPFFDVVVLFSDNIVYNSTMDRVVLQHNENINALLNESDVYLQPLRKKGIKVYLGLLPHHTAAGLNNLSETCARQLATEVADAVNEYGLDGVALDDEYYLKDAVYSDCFAGGVSTNVSLENGARLAYELKSAMKNTCSWETGVCVYTVGSFSKLAEMGSVDGHLPGEFIDIAVADYGRVASPAEGMTLANCSGGSVELNERTGSVASKNYGWCMWFAFNPDPNAGELYNYSYAMPKFKSAASSYYGCGIRTPKGYYKKIGSAKFDPKFYEYNY